MIAAALAANTATNEMTIAISTASNQMTNNSTEESIDYGLPAIF
jgi:hypothetical protein